MNINTREISWMNIIDILNLSAAELKEKRAEAVEAATAVPVDELAGRAVQFLLDAKMRDEKLAEQGKTITLLQGSLESSSDQLNGAIQRIKDLEGELHRMSQSHNDRTSADAAHIGKLEAALAKLQLQAENYRQLAISGRAAINKSAGILNEVIAQFQLADAYNGE